MTQLNWEWVIKWCDEEQVLYVKGDNVREQLHWVMPVLLPPGEFSFLPLSLRIQHLF